MKRLLPFILAAAMLFAVGCSDNKKPEITTAPDTTVTDAPVTTAEVPVAARETRLSFLAAGDNIIHEAIFTDAKKRANEAHPNYNFYDMYAGIADLIAGADISFVNMEGTITGAQYGITGYPDFNAPSEAGDTLVELGFDVVNIANNHMLDLGEKGIANSIEFWKSRPVTLIGGYTKADFDNLRIYEKSGVKIAFLSYTTLINYAHVNELSSSSEYVIPYANEADMTRQVALAKESADFVFVSMHWGTEDNFSPDAGQQKYSKILANLGVDVIIGHHPHVVGKIEWLDGANGGKTLCIYSLGNMISTMHYSQNMAGILASFDIVVSPEGEKSIENVKATPTVTHYSKNRDALQLYKMSDYSEELAAQHGSTLKNTFNYALLQKYITDTISSEYLK